GAWPGEREPVRRRRPSDGGGQGVGSSRPSTGTAACMASIVEEVLGAARASGAAPRALRLGLHVVPGPAERLNEAPNQPDDEEPNDENNECVGKSMGQHSRHSDRYCRAGVSQETPRNVEPNAQKEENNQGVKDESGEAIHFETFRSR